MRRRRRKNPSTLAYVAIGGVALAGVAGVAIFLHKRTETKAAELASANADDAGGILARVSTNDPAPAGDLIIRSGPSSSAPQIGGAEKNGTVIVLDGNASADFARIEWGGGARLPAATGFAHKSALSLVT